MFVECPKSHDSVLLLSSRPTIALLVRLRGCYPVDEQPFTFYLQPTLGSSVKSSEGPEWPVSKLRVTDQTGTLTEEVSHPNLNLGLRLFASRPAPSLACLEMLIEVRRPRPQPLEHSD